MSLLPLVPPCATVVFPWPGKPLAQCRPCTFPSIHVSSPIATADFQPWLPLRRCLVLPIAATSLLDLRCFLSHLLRLCLASMHDLINHSL